ncbi:hypothetical protein RUND412_010698 [Rhizina undulata]
MSPMSEPSSPLFAAAYKDFQVELEDDTNMLMDMEDGEDDELASNPREAEAGKEGPRGKGKEKEKEKASTEDLAATPPAASWPPILPAKEKRKPLTLTELPVDVLREIVKEVNHTNDLTNLSLTCRCLHSLAIPYVYSRFDIVWPDIQTNCERTGVDALTYGLSTLVASGRRGNNYASYVKKFSLGNGPSDWVGEYNINKEGGKMLGTLVYLAATKMEILETFSWDMPTGVLRDVFMALHDLESLKNVHVRFHDNRETTTPTSQHPSRRVETPTFKGFKDLRSLSVLDIDERQYLREISYAIEGSVTKLKELTLGLAAHVPPNGRWVKDLDDLDLIENPSFNHLDAAVGGVLGVILGRIMDLESDSRKQKAVKMNTENGGIPEGSEINAPLSIVTLGNTAPTALYLSSVNTNAPLGPLGNLPGSLPVAPGLLPAAPSVGQIHPPIPLQAGGSSTGSSVVVVENVQDEEAAISETPDLSSTSPQAAVHPSVTDLLPSDTNHAIPSSSSSTPPPPLAPAAKDGMEEKKTRQLHLESLNLERIPLSVRVLTRAIDWTTLQNLTILNCCNHIRLWKALRRKFSPSPQNSWSSSFLSSLNAKSKPTAFYAPHQNGYLANYRPKNAPTGWDYKIRLKKLHTNMVSTHLINFIYETLPPNSLEVLFLQETPATGESGGGVTMESIYKGCIRRHKGSLKKLLIDGNVGQPIPNLHGQQTHPVTEPAAKWVFDREVLKFISSAKMPELRELGLAIEWKDWHYFLSKLPQIPQLRSLFIHRVRDSPLISQCESREMAQQILNTVILRPEIELCYVGIINKCFELLEGGDEDQDGESPHTVNGTSPNAVNEVDSDDEDSEDGDMDDLDDDEIDGVDEDETDSEADAAEAREEEDEDDASEKNRIRLREILFYDDKVAIFKARTGKL